MHPQTEIPGVGTVTLQNKFWTGPELRVDGVAVTRKGRNFALVGKDGGAVPATIEGVYFDAYPTVLANGQRYRTGPATALWLKVVSALPLTVILVFLGGAIPIVLGLGGMAMNLTILRSDRAVNAKVGLMLAVVAAVFLIATAVVVAIARFA